MRLTDVSSQFSHLGPVLDDVVEFIYRRSLNILLIKSYSPQYCHSVESKSHLIEVGGRCKIMHYDSMRLAHGIGEI